MLKMELYRKYPVIVTLWAFMEVVLFAGVIFGWGSLVFILKEEGFYLDQCAENEINSYSLVSNQIVPLTLSNNSLDKGYDVIEGGAISEGSTNETTPGGCPAQESKLNLWFSISVSFMYLSFAGIGYLIRHIGTRKTRIVFFFIYLIGTLCLAFASPELPWLLLPGLCCMGTGGLTMLATNLQVSYLHPRLRSTIVAIFTGLFDFSSINKQIVRIAYENGIARRMSYIFISVLFAVIIATSTLFFLPKMNINEDCTEKRRKGLKNSMHKKTGDTAVDNAEEEQKENHEKLLKTEKNGVALGGSVDFRVTVERSTPSLLSTVLSVTCILHLLWVFVHALRFVTFIGQLNVWLENIFHDDEAKVGEMLAIFSYMTMGAIGTALLCGFLYDYQRKRYMHAGDIRRVYTPVVIPMILVIIYSIGTTVFCYIKHSIAPYFAFALFTFFRSSLFTVAVAFVGDAFPMDYFGVLFGFIQFSSGIAGLVQYPLFQWYEAYEGAYMHVNILLLVLQVLTIIHPIRLYIKGRRDKGDVRNPFRQEYTVSVPSTA